MSTGAEKPSILIRRPPKSPLFFPDRLTERFTLLDPLPAADLRQSLGPEAAGVRLVLSTGLTPVDAGYISCLPSLKCVVTSAAGVDHIDLAECRRLGISVANNGGAFSEDVADYAIGLLIDVLRKISAGDRIVRGLNWSTVTADSSIGCKLGGRRVGIVGLGSIGSLVAKRLVAFGCKVAYNSRTKKSSAPYPYYDNIHSLAQDSDVLVLCCGYTEETRHIVDSNIMSALGARGVIINIGRGKLIDEKEMVRFLVEGKLGGAGLDVFENEPDVPVELFGLDNVVMSHHQAVGTPESLAAMVDAVVGNVEAFFSGEPLLSPVGLD